MLPMLQSQFYYQRHKIISSCCNFASKRNQKLPKLHVKGFERSGYWNEYETKSYIKNTRNKFRFFLESNCAGVRKLFVLVYSKEDAFSKRFKAKRYYLPEGIIDNYNLIINEKKTYYQAIDSDIKQNEEFIKLVKGQGKDCASGCLLDNDYIEKHYRLIAVDLNRKKELDADPNAIKEI